MRTIAVLALFLLAGCVNDTDYRFGGAFSGQRTQADLADFDALVGQYTDDVAIMESFPEQFTIRGLSQDDCEELRNKLMQKSYITTLSVCTLDH